MTGSIERGSNVSRTHQRAEVSRLHSAVWQNHLTILEALLADGVSADAADEEGGWRPLHKAMHWGRLQAAALLLAAGAHAHLPDRQGKTPVHFLSKELRGLSSPAQSEEVYSWGNGSNYQLGSGAEGLQETPARLEGLHGERAIQVEAAKFHSMALTKSGRLYTWGFGRGGRLGHGDFLIHSGEAAVILPLQVPFFAKRKVIQIAASKHHSAAITSSGELFTWGSNRDGRLGYPAADTQPTPRKLTTFNRQRVYAVALANRHSVALLDNGVLYSWGSNNQGQLGYGTSDSTSNAVPRMVEAMKGKHISQVAAAKRHTVVLTMEGNVYQWGHGTVTPKRVILAGRRDIARAVVGQGGKTWELVFHKGQSEVSKPTAVQVTAGAAHSSVVTSDGTVMTWRSMDPSLTPTAVADSLAGQTVVKVSAGKYRTAAVTDTGEVFMWEGWSKAAEATPKGLRNPVASGTSPPPFVPAEWDLPKGAKHRRSGKAQAFQVITPQRVEGLLRVTDVAVGEKHSIALSSWCAAPTPFLNLGQEGEAPPPTVLQRTSSTAESTASGSADEQSPSHPELGKQWSGPRSRDYWDAIEAGVRDQKQHDHLDHSFSLDDEAVSSESPDGCGVTSLQMLCEMCVAVSLVEPRTALQVLEYADSAGAEALKLHCIGVVLSNLDLIVLEAAQQFAQLAPHLLAELESLWCQYCPRSIRAVASDEESETLTQLQSLEKLSSSLHLGDESLERAFRNPEEEEEAAERSRQERNLRKKIQQIEVLEERAEREVLNEQQRAKVSLRPVLDAALHALQVEITDSRQKRKPLEDIKQVLADAQARVTVNRRPASGERPEAGLSIDRKRKPRRSSVNPSISQAGLPDEPQGLSVESMASSPPSMLPSGYRGSLHGASATSADAVPQTIGFEVARPTTMATPTKDIQSGFVVASPAADLQAEEGASQSQGLPITPLPNVRTPAAQTGASSSKKPSKRRGGLSMFLAGDLDSPEKVGSQKPPAAQPSSATVTPAKPPGSGWGAGLQTPVQPSLRDILSEQSQEKSSSLLKTPPASHRPSEDGKLNVSSRSPAVMSRGETPQSAGADHVSNAGGLSIALGDLVKKSTPRQIAPPAAASVERRGPAWGGVPLGASPSRLLDIQAEEEHKRENSARSWGALGSSPSQKFGQALTWQQGRSADPASASPGISFPMGTSPSSRRSQLSSQAPQSKWYIKEEPEIVALRSIQTEETALKELSEYQQQEAEKAAEEERNAEEAAKKKKRQRNRKSTAKRRSSEGGGGPAHIEGSVQAPEAATTSTLHHPPRRKSKAGQSDHPPTTNGEGPAGPAPRRQTPRRTPRRHPPPARPNDSTPDPDGEVQGQQGAQKPPQGAHKGRSDEVARTNARQAGRRQDERGPDPSYGFEVSKSKQRSTNNQPIPSM